MIDSKTHLQPRLYDLQKVLRSFQYFLSGSYILVFSWVLGSTFCQVGVCQSVSLSENFFSSVVLFHLSLFALVNSLIIGLAYYFFDDETEINILFYLGLFGLFSAYLLYGLFFQEFVQIGQKKILPNGLFYAEFIIIFTSTLIFFEIEEIWKKINLFIKIKLILTILLITSLIISSFIGLALGIILIPLISFCPDNLEQLLNKRKILEFNKKTTGYTPYHNNFE